MNWAILLASVALAGVAAAGVVRPFGARRHVTLERLADPLEDERLSALRALLDLDEERAGGELSDESYRALRWETEVRAVAVLRALEARDGAGELGADLRAIRVRSSANGDGSGRGAASAGAVGRPGGRGRVLAPVLLGVVALAVVVPLLAHAVGNREPGRPDTGTISTPANPLSFFVQRVRDHPKDVAARLDLGERYLQTGDVQDAIPQYIAALQIDPRNAEAHATLGFLLFRAGHPQDGLRAVDQALAVDPTYPQALYYQGIILLQGLHQPEQAARSFRAYLQDAQFGGHREEVRQLLTGIENPSPSPTG